VRGDDHEALVRAHRRVAKAHRAYAKRLRRTGQFPGDVTAIRMAERQLALVRSSIATDDLPKGENRRGTPWL
jgi:hypothetical protein